MHKLPKTKTVLAAPGHDADWFRKALQAQRIAPCIPPCANRKCHIRYDTKLYKKRHKIVNMFAQIKDWRRIAMRDDRCAHTFFSAICIAATFIFYLKE